MGRLSLVTGSLTTLQLPTLALRQISQPVPQDVAPDLLHALITEMFACMYAAHGCGLAAPQVGVLWRVFLLDLSPSTGTPPLVLINPELLDRDDEIEEGREGCLSIPGYRSRKVPRARRVTITGYDHRLERITLEVAGDMARGIQHEYDHLDGILYIDRLASWDDLEPHPDGSLHTASTVLDQDRAATDSL